MSPLLRSRNWHNVVAPLQQPRQRNLSRRHSLLVSNLAYHRRGAHVGIEVLAPITRVFVTKILRRIFLSPLYVPGKKSAAQRRKWNQANPEVTAKRNQTRLQIAL